LSLLPTATEHGAKAPRSGRAFAAVAVMIRSQPPYSPPSFHRPSRRPMENGLPTIAESSPSLHGSRSQLSVKGPDVILYPFFHELPVRCVAEDVHQAIFERLAVRLDRFPGHACEGAREHSCKPR